MSHSHIPVKHLLKQVEIHRSRRERRDPRPAWVTELIDNVAGLFEPMLEDARVGFECRPVEDRWVIGMYLGSTEIVGGPDDGRARHLDFQFDLRQLTRLFSQVDDMQWSAFPRCSDSDCPDNDDLPANSFIMVEGRVDDQPVRLRLYSVPPSEAGPALRQYPDGSCTPV